MSLRLSWLSSLPYLPRVCLYPRTSTPFTDPWSGHSSVIPWIGGPSSGGCCHGNCRGNRRQTRGHGRLPGVKTLDERQRQRYNHGPCGAGVPWDKKKSAFCGETAAGRIFVAGHVSRRGSSTGTWHLFKVVSEIFYQGFSCGGCTQKVLYTRVWKLEIKRLIDSNPHTKNIKLFPSFRWCWT